MSAKEQIRTHEIMIEHFKSKVRNTKNDFERALYQERVEDHENRIEKLGGKKNAKHCLSHT